MFHKRTILLKLLLAALLLLSSGRLAAQDPIFSQFFSAPVYLNPAFAGNQHSLRTTLSFRSHPLPDVTNVSTFLLSADGPVETLSGALALLATSDYQGNMLWDNHISGIYAYHMSINADWHMNFGVQAGYFRRELSWSRLVFYDPAQTPPASAEDWRHVVDFAAGVLFFNEQYYGGIAMHHLSQPNISLTGEEMSLDRKFTAHLGMNFEGGSRGGAFGRGPDYFLSPNLIYQKQGPHQRIHFGMYGGMEPLLAGMWLQHNPGSSPTMVFLLGVSWQDLHIGYSYDHNFSGFTDLRHGVHEISLSFHFFTASNNRHRARCPYL